MKKVALKPLHELPGALIHGTQAWQLITEKCLKIHAENVAAMAKSRRFHVILPNNTLK